MSTAFDSATSRCDISIHALCTEWRLHLTHARPPARTHTQSALYQRSKVEGRRLWVVEIIWLPIPIPDQHCSSFSENSPNLEMSHTNNNACIVCAKSFTSSEERDEHEMGQHFCENGVLDLLFSQYDECTERKSKRRKTEDGNAWAGHNVRMSKLNLFWTQEKQAIRDNRERLLASQAAIELAIQEHQTKLRDLSSQLDANAESETKLAKQCSIKQNQEAARFKLEKEDRQVQRHQEDFDMHNKFIDGVVSTNLTHPAPIMVISLLHRGEPMWVRNARCNKQGGEASLPRSCSQQNTFRWRRRLYR